ncbi:uncharacterized protein LOC116603222 [Nematostella vectensis]|uniref:uncharacterized protein LOC116603222 n=1 Tax=Nematostella vectensis TaxID=45351 RepID=UPI00207768D8|nr:uncharacterized protein LOC116603222 [Nematostella vectensis]
MTAIRDTAQELGAISWTLLAQETAADARMGNLLHSLEQGTQLNKDDPTLANLGPIYESIYQEEGVLMYQDRVVIPHPYVSGYSRACTPLTKEPHRWNSGPGPSYTGLERAVTGQNPPPLPTAPPSTPFEAVFADFFDYKGYHYLVVGDRLSGWVEVLSSPATTNLAGSTGLIRHLRTFFATFGVPEELSSDGGPEFTAKATEDFLRTWDVKQRLSSVSFPQSNGRAEVAVKTAKRLLLSNTGPTGSLDQDRFLRAILQLRNTPDPDCSLSPAQIIFGRPLRDTLAFVNRQEKFSNPHIRPLWRQAWAAKEDALRTRISRTTESLREHARPLRPLAIGTRVFLQNQQGPNPNKWDRSGVVVEAAGHDQYRVKVYGSGRVTLRNRRFLRAYTPALPTIPQAPSGAPAKTLSVAPAAPSPRPLTGLPGRPSWNTVIRYAPRYRDTLTLIRKFP